MNKIKIILLTILTIFLLIIVIINFPSFESTSPIAEAGLSAISDSIEEVVDEIEDLESGDLPDDLNDTNITQTNEDHTLNQPTKKENLKKQVSEIKNGIIYKTAEIAPNQGLFQALMDVGIKTSEALKIINALRFDVELVSLRAGAQFKIGMKVLDSTLYSTDTNITTYDSIQIVSLSYKKHPALIHHLDLNNKDSLVYRKEIKETRFEYQYYTNKLRAGSSLNNMLLDAKIPPNLTQVVNGVLLCKIDFRTDAQPNDEFKVLIRNEFYKDTLIEGRVIYTSYNGVNSGFHQAFRYDAGEQSSFTAHYTIDGEALVHSGLRYPVDKLLISSNYGWRTHPVTGKRKFHYGIDYAAGNRSPIYAVAPGVVVKSTQDKYSGKYVAIRHADNSQSYYLHMSSKSVHVGNSVRSRQIIGRVGATGRVTGPHLHFGIKGANGKWMNPNKKRMIATPKLEGEHFNNLMKQVNQILPILNNLEADYYYQHRMEKLGLALSKEELKALEFNEEQIDKEVAENLKKKITENKQ